tara:strand:- start:1029 stop:1451 length:423 start_codon:yes stop_codon:yes gene_type:complete
MSKKVKYNRNEIDKVSQLIVDKIKTIKTIILRGELGSGKTTLVKSVLKKMGVNESVTSPTFSIVNEYNFAGSIVYHFDLYRIENIEELNVIGFEDYIYSQNTCFIEWPEIVMENLNFKYLDLEIRYLSDDKREIVITEIN